MYNLPFDPVNITEPFYQIDVNQPPCIPRIGSLQEPWMASEPYLVFTASLVALEIQSRAGENPLRTFMFNRIAFNAYQNQDFASLVKFTLEFTGMMLLRRRYIDRDQGISTAVPYIITLCIADSLRECPDLSRYIDQQMYNEVTEMIGEFDSVQRDLAGYRQGYTASNNQAYDPRIGQDPRAQARPIAGGGYAPNTNMQAGVAGAGVRRVMPTRPQQPVGGEVRLPSKPNVYAARRPAEPQYEAPVQVETQPQQHAFAGRFKKPSVSLHPPIHSRSDASMSAAPNDLQVLGGEPEDGNMGFLIKEDESEYTWIPTEAQPYRPMYHPLTEERYHRIYPDGTVVVEVHLREEGLTMEQDVHKLPIFGNVRTGFTYDPVRAMEKLTRVAEELPQTLKLVEDEAGLTESDLSEEASEVRQRIMANKHHVYVDPILLCDVSERVLWFNTNMYRIERMAKQPDIPLDMHTTFAVLAEPVVSMLNNDDFIKSLAESKTYLELAEKLNHVPGEDEAIDLKLVETINKRLIIMINRVIALYLGIPGGEPRIEGRFDTESITELETYLKDNYGPVIHTAFRAHQRKHIRSVFLTTWEPKVKGDLDAQLMGNTKFPEGQAPHVSYLVGGQSFTHLNLKASEFDIAIDTDTSTLIERGSSKALYLIAETIFNAARVVEKTPFYRHLIQTSDGEILEILRGDIGQDAYLIARHSEAWLTA